MTETAGFSAGAFLPRGVLAAWRDEERREAQQARQEAAEKAERVEHRRSTSLAEAARMATERGEDVTALMVATGQIPARTLGDIFAEASAAADQQDARRDFEDRKARGERPEFIGELADPSARSRAPMTPRRRELERREEKFLAAAEASQRAQQTRRELEDLPGMAPPPWWRNRTRGASQRSQGHQGYRVRGGGYVTRMY